MNRIPSFKDLSVWQKAMDLVDRSYDLTKAYPADERFDLVAETRKTARSVPYTIAEDKMRLTAKDFRRHVAIALGSLGELQTHQTVAAVEGQNRRDRQDVAWPGARSGYCLMPIAECPVF